MNVRFAPVPLGCCREARRCLLCAPPPAWPGADWVAAARVAAGPEPVTTFFVGGAPPDDAQLAVAGAGPHARVRPDLLSRAEARRLIAAGVRRVELDALSFDDAVLVGVGRRHRAQVAREQADFLRAAGLEVSLILAPGLPGSSHALALADAAEAARLATHLRIHPVLVLDDSGLREAHLNGRYEPLDLAQAITTCRGMLEIAESAGVRVVRVGQQPRQDGLGRAVAGPRHPALRELVEARRALDRLRGLLDGTPPGRQIVIRCAPADETRTRGPLNRHIRLLRADYRLQSLHIEADPALERGDLAIDRVGDS